MKSQTIIFLILLVPASAMGTHLKGGYIRIEHASYSTLDYRITLRIYTSASGVAFGGDDSELDFGDGTSYLLPEQLASALNDDTGVVQYSIRHVYSAYGAYVVSYTEPNRNTTVNLERSVNTPFYVESFFKADPLYPGYASPELLTDPVVLAPLQSEFTYGISAVDVTGHQLNYGVRTPSTKEGVLTALYTLPENFYVNPFNGTVVWDTKFKDSYQPGEYLFNVRIFQFKGDILMGYMSLEFPVILHDHDERLQLRPQQSLDENNRIYIEPGKAKTVRVFFQTHASSSMELDSFTDLDPANWIFSVYDSIRNSMPIKVGLLTLTSEPEAIRDDPYIFTIRGTSISDKNFEKDLTLMIFTKDLDVTGIPIILSAEKKSGAFQLYPNPVLNALYIQGPPNRIFTITLYNLSGQTVYHGSMSSENPISLASFPVGMYHYDIRDARSREKGRLIKK